MKIEQIRLKNFKSFKNVEIKQIPAFCVIVGANGSGKSTIFSVFAFLRDAMNGNVNAAITKLGGSRGINEVRSRGAKGAIEIELKFRVKPGKPLITYSLKINEKKGKAYIEREILKYRRGRKGKPWHFIDFKDGEGMAVTNEVDNVKDVSELEKKYQTLKSNDILAIKGLAQFEQFPAAVALSNLIENWHISDFHINKARLEQEASFAEHLSREGENLSLVIDYYYKNHKDIFNKILELLRDRIPGINKVESKITEEGRVLLKFQDEEFEDPFLARYVSDGTIKMLSFLILLYDPQPHPLLCVEEPENQLYPKLLWELAEEFRSYSNRGGQVFVSTHSPDFLNATQIDEVFWLEKIKGYTQVKRAQNNKQIFDYMNDGDQMGRLWSNGLFGEVDPN